MAVVGNNVIVYRDGVAIAGTRSNEVGAIAEMFETASPVSGDWKTRRKGRKDWSLNVGYLVVSEAGVADLLTIGTEYTLLFKGENDPGVTGKALLHECRISATIGTLVTGSFSFKGNGALTVVASAPQTTILELFGDQTDDIIELMTMATSAGKITYVDEAYEFVLIDGEDHILAAKLHGQSLVVYADEDSILNAILSEYNSL